MVSITETIWYLKEPVPTAEHFLQDQVISRTQMDFLRPHCFTL